MTISAVLKNVLVFQMDKENFWATREIQRKLIVIVILVLIITNDLIWLPRSSKLLYFCNTNSTEIGFLFIPPSYRTGEGNGTPLQYSCLENPWTEEPGRLQSMGSLRVGHDWATSLSLFTFMHWRRKWQPTLVFLPGESQGWGSLVGCRLWGHTESDMTEVT